MFDSVLVANRGEIAVRVIRSLRSLGVRSVAVYSDADRRARHVQEADLAVRIGPAPAGESYLSIGNVIAAARRSGAQAIHPGYGFLSENAEFVRSCERAGLVFIGPTARAVEIMGDKIRAKRVVAAAGVPVVPGRFEPGMTDADLAEAAAEIGYPVLVKPAAGGGGKGMRLVDGPAGLGSALISARREALASFGDDSLFVERLIARPRHIEVQVLADQYGDIIHLGERECSLQRRHQKIIEEAPSVLIDPGTRDRIGPSAIETARSVAYLGAGTVEFIVAANHPDEFFFLEMNTRLQVEHPVTELVTGLDLVVEQVRIASGEPLRHRQDEIHLRGHAIEARVYAEDPERGFLPSPGVVLALREPTDRPGVRVDSGLQIGAVIGTRYDPMLSKVIAWGPDRGVALARLGQALAGTVVLGCGTNLEFLQTLIADPEVQAGRLDTQLVDRELPRLIAGESPVPDRALAVYALFRLLQLEPRSSVPGSSVPGLNRPGSGGSLWDRPTGWRIGDPRPLRVRVGRPGADVDTAAEVWIAGSSGAATIGLPAGTVLAAALVDHDAGRRELMVELDGITGRWLYALDGRLIWLWCAGQTWALREIPTPSRRGAEVTGGSELRSPMPGVVLAVNAEVGQPVRIGQSLIVVEAMKMEHDVVAVRDGRLEQLLVRVGDQVALDQVLAITG